MVLVLMFWLAIFPHVLIGLFIVMLVVRVLAFVSKYIPISGTTFGKLFVAAFLLFPLVFDAVIHHH